MDKTENLKRLIEEKQREGQIAFFTFDSIVSADTSKFIHQSADGILYDLNRDEASILASAKDGNPYWVNNYAAAQVIRALCAERDRLKVQAGKLSKSFASHMTSLIIRDLDSRVPPGKMCVSSMEAEFVEAELCSGKFNDVEVWIQNKIKSWSLNLNSAE